jgi:hypothetical protein
LAADAVSETWRPVVEAIGLYEVSSLGRVRSLYFDPPRMLRTPPNNHGYPFVTICVDGHKLNRRVHQLVTEAFIGPRPEGLVIRHLDGNKLNNASSNLTYGTAVENAQDCISHGANPQLGKSACPKGHRYDEANTRVTPLGHRRCRACARERAARDWRLHRDARRAHGAATDARVHGKALA